MGDRRVLLGTSAVLVGLGSALISGTAVAAAETGDSKPDTSTSAGESSAPAATERRANTRTRPAPAAASDDDASVAPTPTATRGVRPGNRAARSSAVRANPERNAPVPTVNDLIPAVAPEAVPDAPRPDSPRSGSTGPDAAVPTAAVSVQAPTDPESAPVAPVVAAAADAPAAPVASATPAPAPAPAATLLSTGLTGLGWQPAGGLVVAAPALAAFSGQRHSAAPAAVIGTPLVAGDPPDPT
ncbi:MAG: hypothetical protein WD228_03820, partial [Mycobacterium sp.]